MANILAGASHFTISGGTFAIHSNTAARASAFDKLVAVAAHGALHDAPSRTNESRCHQHTRTNVLDHLVRWAQGICDESASIFWLHGGAGAGKSAIMQTLAERCVALGLALGSFFFSRRDATRNSVEALVSTLVYQLAQSFPATMQVLDPIIDREPLIFKKSLQVQLLGLLVPVLQHLVQLGIISDAAQSPRVFLIDGLDECNEPSQQQAVIHAVAAVCHEHRIPVKFLIASRPEYAISTSFEWYKEENYVLGTISLSEDADAEADIRRFLEDEFLKLCVRHPLKRMIPSKWPSLYDINRLVWKSSSHFIYASTVMKYIWSAKESPLRSLQVILGLAVCRTTSPFAELDGLYHHIIGSAAHLDEVLQILAHCLYTRLPSLNSIICIMLNCSKEDLSIFMADMTPLMALSQSASSPHEHKVKLLHASLGDFLRDQSRSGSLYLDEEGYLASKLERYFQLLDLHSRRKRIQLDWLASPDRMFSLPYVMLRSQIFISIRKSGHLPAAQEVLKQYRLRDFYQCQLRFKHMYQGIYDPPGPEDLSRLLVAVRSIKTSDDDMPFKSFVEDFFDILELYLGLESTALTPAILPLICFGYPAQALCQILSYHCPGSQSHRLITEPFYDDSLTTVLDYITPADLASIHHGVNTSPQRLAVAAEAILGYIIDDQLQMHCWLTYSVYKAWLQRTKPGKHVATGAPRLASALQARCVRTSRFLERLAYNGRPRKKDQVSKLDSPSTVKFLGLRPPFGLYKLERWQAKLAMTFNLLHALLWVLPNAGFSEGIVQYSKRVLPQVLYQHKPGLVRRVRKCLDMYTSRVHNAKLKELEQKIADGDVNALIEKSRMTYLNAQD